MRADLLDLILAIDPSGPTAVASVGLPADLTYDEALALQHAALDHRVKAGDPLAGHNAALSGAGARKAFPDAPNPLVGAFTASSLFQSGATVRAPAGVVLVEAEIAIRLARDVEGANLTPDDVRDAVGAWLPAIDVAFSAGGFGGVDYTWPQIAALQKIAGYNIIGADVDPASIADVEADRCTMTLDGELRVEGGVADLLGGPLQVLCNVAAQLSAIGRKLQAGEVILTGALGKPYVLKPHETHAVVSFGAIGAVEVRFSR